MATTYTPQTYTAQTGQVTDWNVDDKQTAQGQLAGMLKSDSPLMQWSATQGKQQAQKRGLLNSSMGIEASQNAMIQNAAPIAQQDANTFAQAGQFNASNKTTGSFNNAQAENTARQFNAGSANTFALADKQTEADFAKMAKQQDYTQQNMGTQQGFDLSKMQKQQDYTLQGLSAQQINDMQKMAAQQTYNVQNLNIQQSFNERMATMEQEGLDYRQARDIASREAITQLEQAGITNRFDQELALKSDMFNAEQTNMERRQILEQQARLQELGLRIDADKQTIPTSFAANIANTTMNGVNSIMADGSLDATKKQAAIDNVVKYANAQIGWAEAFYSTQIPRLTAPTPAPVAA